MTQLHDDLDLEVLRSINAETVAKAEALSRVRGRVVPSPSLRPSRPWGIIAAASAAALALGLLAGFALPKMITPVRPTVSETPAPSSPVSAFVDAAARASLLSAATEVRPTQYLKLTSRSTSQGGSAIEMDDHGAAVAVGHFAVLTTTSTYVPADRTKSWVRTVVTKMSPLDAVARRLVAKDPTLTKPMSEPAQRATAGNFPDVYPDAKVANDALTQDYLRLLPRDPRALLNSILDNTGYPPAAPDQLRRLALPLGVTWLDDKDLRAALLRAIGLIEGAQLTDSESIGGHSGTALRVGYPDTPGAYVEAVFDPISYQLIGLRENLPAAPKQGVVDGRIRITGPSTGLTMTETTFVSEIVNSAP